MNEPGSVRVDNLRKEFDNVVAVEGLQLEIGAGEFLTILGPSGCGKSTTLRCIAGLESPTAGDVYISGDRVTDQPANQRDTSIVFQEWALFPHMTVEENVSFGLEMQGVPKAEREERIRDVLELVELPGYEDRRANELSGGQKQRVAMARSIVREPDVLLLDEPLASLDRALRQRMQVELKNIQEELGVTFIYVTHDQEEALTMSDRIAVMNEGQLEQIASATELYERPETVFVAEFLGETNIFEGPVRRDGDVLVLEDGDKRVRMTAPGENDEVLADGGSLAMTVRPERLHISRDRVDLPNEWSGRIVNAIYKGSNTLYEVDVDGQLIKVEQQRQRDVDLYEEGETVVVGFDLDDGEVIPQSM